MPRRGGPQTGPQPAEEVPTPLHSFLDAGVTLGVSTGVAKEDAAITWVLLRRSEFCGASIVRGTSCELHASISPRTRLDLKRERGPAQRQVVVLLRC